MKKIASVLFLAAALAAAADKKPDLKLSDLEKASLQIYLERYSALNSEERRLQAEAQVVQARKQLVQQEYSTKIQEIFKNRGLDPAKYDVNLETGMIVERPAEGAANAQK